MKIEFTVLGEPRGKGRPRFTKSGHVYTPKETSDYEMLVRASLRKAYPQLSPFEGRLRVYIDAYFPIPKSYTTKMKCLAHNHLISPEKKPDCDNIAKVILDALNGVAYIDDKQVVQLQVYKHYDDQPQVRVHIEDF